MNILDKIIETKRLEVANMKKSRVSFVDKLKNNEYVSIIAEIKRASPSKGNLNIDLSPRDLAEEYEKGGASAISVLTDRNYFKGSHKDLLEAKESTSLPVLCKDFIIDEAQIDYAYLTGADIILLIVAALNDEELKRLYDYARGKGLDVIVEVHNEEEVDRALLIGPRVIGVNNRNLKTFETDIKNTLKLSTKIKDSGAFLISESGIKDEEDINTLAEAGVDGLLVGESFVTSDNIAEKFSAFKIKRR